MIRRDRTKGPVDVRGLARMVTRPIPPQRRPNIPRPILLSNQLRGCSCDGHSGLGLFNVQSGAMMPGGGTTSVLGSVTMGLNLIPGVGPVASSALSILTTAVDAVSGWLGIGAGRQEADLITPLQNDVMSQLGRITNSILSNANPSVSELQSYYREVWQIAVGFMEFTLQPFFTDRRASGQALNTVMPYIDGTCGYPVPLGTAIPTTVQTNCLQWGAGTVGGVGTDGMLGAIKRAIQHQGGVVPTLPTTSLADAANNGFDVTEDIPPGVPWGGGLTMGSSTMLPVLIGAAALFLYSRKAL